MNRPQLPRGAPGRTPGTGIKQAEAGSIKPGAVVFFPVCAKTTKPTAQPYIFKGKGFGIFLGVTPPGMGEPTKEMIPALLAGIGWVSFEDVFELLGEDQFKILETKFRAKYEVPEGEKAAAPAEPPKIALPPERKLVSVDGTPLVNPKSDDTASQ